METDRLLQIAFIAAFIGILLLPIVRPSRRSGPVVTEVVRMETGTEEAAVMATDE